MAISLQFNGDLLYIAFKRTMQLDFDLANTGNPKPFVTSNQGYSITIFSVFECKTAIASLAFEAWVSRLRGMCGFLASGDSLDVRSGPLHLDFRPVLHP